MYKGQIEGFPVEVVEKMMEAQEEQGNKKDPVIFYLKKDQNRYFGGFDWADYQEQNGLPSGFWADVIRGKKFDLFYKYFPKVPTFKIKHIYEK